jgi:hypothetical protein
MRQKSENIAKKERPLPLRVYWSLGVSGERNFDILKHPYILFPTLRPN